MAASGSSNSVGENSPTTAPMARLPRMIGAAIIRAGRAVPSEGAITAAGAREATASCTARVLPEVLWSSVRRVEARTVPPEVVT